MPPQDDTLIALEKQFWKALVDQDTDAALALLHEPALMVSAHGAMEFDHAAYRRMVQEGTMAIKSFTLDDIKVLFPSETTAVLTYGVKQTLTQRGKPQDIEQKMTDSSVWVRKDGQWLCAMHTETPVAAQPS